MKKVLLTVGIILFTSSVFGEYQPNKVLAYCNETHLQPAARTLGTAQGQLGVFQSRYAMNGDPTVAHLADLALINFETAVQNLKAYRGCIEAGVYPGSEGP